MLQKIFAATAMIAGGIASLGTVAAFFGSLWWPLDLMANFRWQMMWIAFAAAVVYALAGKGIFTIVFLVAVAVNAWLILPVWTGSQPDATGEGTVRVAHIDISGTVDDMGSVGTWLVDTDADLILVAGATGDDVEAIGVPGSTYLTLNSPGAEAGIAIFGKTGWKISTLLSDDGQPVYTVTVPSGNGVMDIVTSWGPMGTSQPAAVALSERIGSVAVAAGSSTNPVIVIGNLGATKWALASRSLLSTADLRDATAGAGYLPTWPHAEVPIIGRWIGIPIDVVYMSPEVTPINVIAGPDIGADHIPLVIDISPSTVDS